MPSVKVGGRDVHLERFTVAKAMRVMTLLSVIQKQVPSLNKELAAFRSEYRKANSIELDRVQAKMRYGPQPVLDDEGEPIMQDGEIVTIASPIDRMTEQDWERAGQVLRLPQSPTPTETLVAMFPTVYEAAEQPVQRLLAIVAMPNDDVTRHVRNGTIWDEVDRFADEVIAPAYLDEIMELAVAAGEVIDDQVMSKAKGLGERAGNLLRLAGIQTTTSEDSGSPPETSETLSEPAEKESTDSSTPSPPDSIGLIQTGSSDSAGTPLSTSATSSS